MKKYIKCYNFSDDWGKRLDSWIEEEDEYYYPPDFEEEDVENLIRDVKKQIAEKLPADNIIIDSDDVAWQGGRVQFQISVWDKNATSMKLIAEDYFKFHLRDYYFDEQDCIDDINRSVEEFVENLV